MQLGPVQLPCSAQDTAPSESRFVTDPESVTVWARSVSVATAPVVWNHGHGEGRDVRRLVCCLSRSESTSLMTPLIGYVLEPLCANSLAPAQVVPGTITGTCREYMSLYPTVRFA